MTKHCIKVVTHSIQEETGRIAISIC